MSGVIHRNIDALVKVREEQDRKRSLADKVAQRITDFTGSIPFVVMHVVLLAAWLLINNGYIAGIAPFDPPPYVLLAVVASLEAIFLTSFVLIGQNLMARNAERRAELDVQVNLLAEHEITRLIKMVEEIGHRLGIEPVPVEELSELKNDVDPEEVWKEIEKAEDESAKRESA